MSTKIKKQYTREYKLEVLELLKTSGKSKAQLERDLGLYQGQIKAWQQALAEDGHEWLSMSSSRLPCPVVATGSAPTRLK